MLLTYAIAKFVDTWYWATVLAPSQGFTLMDFYTNNPLYGIWILITEIAVCGFVPAVILITQKGRRNPVALWIAISLAVIGVCLNRWVMVLQIMAVPVMTFDQWVLYFPSWQEVATTILPVAYGIILIAISYRYLPVFPNEAELNPMEPLPAEEFVESPVDLEPDLKPVEA